VTAADAERALALSGADAVMVGRGGYGQPWAAGMIARAAGAARDADRPPLTRPALADYVIAHHQDMLTLYGIGQGIRHARKHLGWYIDRHAPHTPPELRTALLTTHAPQEAALLIWQVFHDAQALAEAA
jgi:tRNA-dihydrouridine synthase